MKVNVFKRLHHQRVRTFHIHRSVVMSHSHGVFCTFCYCIVGNFFPYLGTWSLRASHLFHEITSLHFLNLFLKRLKHLSYIQHCNNLRSGDDFIQFGVRWWSCLRKLNRILYEILTESLELSNEEDTIYYIKCWLW